MIIILNLLDTLNTEQTKYHTKIHSFLSSFIMATRVKEEIIPFAPPPQRKRRGPSSNENTQHVNTYDNDGFALPAARHPQTQRRRPNENESNSNSNSNDNSTSRTSLNSNSFSAVGFTIDREPQLPPSQVHSRSRTFQCPTSSVRYGGGGGGEGDGGRLRRHEQDFHGHGGSASGRTSLFSHTSSAHAHSHSHTKSRRTSAITLLDTNHGRHRRHQRNIPRRDVQVAIKYGRKQRHPTNPNLCIYRYNGKKHVISEEESRRLVTTMVSTIDLQPKDVSPQEMQLHDQHYNIIHKKIPFTCNQTNQTSATWKSHSILIVDKSGSMRESDVNGCRTRLGAVWLSLAQDFVEHRLNIGTASGMDVVSVILMGEKAELIIDRHPTNTILYNRIVKLFWDSERADEAYSRGQRCIPGLIRPSGHGCYGPSLRKAEEMLDEFDEGDAECALHILLLSDGKPSDGYLLFESTNGNGTRTGTRRGDNRKLTAEERAERKAKVSNAHTDASKTLQDCVEKIASKYGRRFNFSAIGMGHKKEYDCLKTLVVSATNYGSQVSLLHNIGQVTTLNYVIASSNDNENLITNNTMENVFKFSGEFSSSWTIMC